MKIKKNNAINVCKNAKVPKRIFDSCVTDVIQHGTSIHLKKRPKSKKSTITSFRSII